MKYVVTTERTSGLVSFVAALATTVLVATEARALMLRVNANAESIMFVQAKANNIVPIHNEAYKIQSQDNLLIFSKDWLDFVDLAQKWRYGRNSFSSSTRDILLDPSYILIIGMGERALPFILGELRREMTVGEPDDWFAALWSITRVNPVPVESRGNAKEMAIAWLKWGIQEGHIHDEGGVGPGGISEFGRFVGVS
jgi:hypothetical protein